MIPSIAAELIMKNNNIPYLHLPGSGEDLHFFGANGFPAGTYTPILTGLSEQFNVYAMQCRATWPNIGHPSHKNWELYADDLIQLASYYCGGPQFGG